MTTVTQETSRKQFLTVLFEAFLQESEGLIETREFFLDRARPEARFHRTIDAIVSHTPAGDYYFGVCPRLRTSGKKEDVGFIVSLWVDLDIPLEQAKERLKGFPNPSIIISSGFHTQIYWLLKKTETVKPNIENILKGLAIALGADHCHDLSRILRVPDTKNFKKVVMKSKFVEICPDGQGILDQLIQKKFLEVISPTEVRFKPSISQKIDKIRDIAKRDFDKVWAIFQDALKDQNNFKYVEVAEFNPEIRYTISEFDSYGVQVQENGGIQNLGNREEQDTELKGLKLSKETVKLIKDGKQEGDGFKSRSEADYKVVHDLIKAYCSEDAVEAIFAKHAIGAKYREQGITYLKHTIDRARQNIMDSLQNKSKVVGGSLLDQRKIIYSGGNFYEYRDGCYREVNIEIVKRWVMGITSSKKDAEEIIYFLQARAFVDVKDLNKSGYLNLKNGLLDLISGQLLGHDSNAYSTIQLDVNYNPNARCDLWIKTLKEIFPFEGEDDKISDLQEFFGLCFTKETKFGKALLCVGEGANGKSLILGIIAKLLGDDNIAAIPLEKFDNAHYIVNLFGKLANVSIETNAKSDVYDSVFKAVVSGDPIQADQKYKPSFHFRPFSKLIIATNNLPRVDDKSDAYFRRLLIIRFNKQFTEIQQNKNLSEELMLEAEGILNWCLEGLKRLNARGRFDEKEYLKKEIHEYRVENNNVLLYVNESCVLHSDVSTPIGYLYDDYVNWCKNTGCYRLQKIRFGKEIQRQFKELTKETTTNGVWVWQGIEVREATRFQLTPDGNITLTQR